MKKIANILFKGSSEELKYTRTLVTASLFVSMILVLDALNIRINFSPSLRMTFDFLVVAICGTILGPLPTILMAAAADLLGWMINSGGLGFSPGFTLAAMLSAWIWSTGLYNERISYVRILIVNAINNAIVNIAINSFLLYFYFNQAIFAELPVRIAKNLLLLPLESLIIFLVAKEVKRFYKPQNRLPLRKAT